MKRQPMRFDLTPDAIRERRKTVTRRRSWHWLRTGDLLQAVTGEAREHLADLRVASVSREPLGAITPDECAREGFPGMTPAEFVVLFCQHMKGATPKTIVTRIEFEYEAAQP